jgi:hypothetical protein
MWSFAIAMTHCCGLSILRTQQAQACQSGLLGWIECLFKNLKRGGFGWHQTKMKAPRQAEPLWLALAVVSGFLVSIAGKAEANRSASSLPPLSEIPSALKTDDNPTPPPSKSSNFNHLPTQFYS